MFIDELMLLGYRGIAAVLALALALRVLRAEDRREQVYAAMVFVPIVLRALGVK